MALSNLPNRCCLNPRIFGGVYRGARRWSYVESVVLCNIVDCNNADMSSPRVWMTDTLTTLGSWWSPCPASFNYSRFTEQNGCRCGKMAVQKHRQWQCTVLPIFEVREAKGQVSGSFQYPQSDGRSNQVLSFVFLNCSLRRFFLQIESIS